MTRHLDDGSLQDFLEGLLDSEAQVQVQAHLDVCPQCRAETESLKKLLEDLGGLPLEAQPSRDLWPQIAWRMEGSKGEPERSEGEKVGPVPATDPIRFESQGTGPSDRERRRRITLPAWQLMAASIALILISGGTVWTFLSGRLETGSGAGPVPVSPGQMVGWEEAYGGYDEAVADLEAVLESGREILDPETVRVVEENLRVIDQAIQEAGEALEQDPASTVLQRFLADNLRKKMDLLRRAAMAVYAIT